MSEEECEGEGERERLVGRGREGGGKITCKLYQSNPPDGSCS